MSSSFARRAFATALAAAAFAAFAQPATSPLQVEGAWARTTVPGQSGTGGFMRLTAREPLTLLGASSPAAGVVEVHEMKMEGDVMKMRPLASLPLPAGQPVELKPGGLHLMLMELKAPLAQGTQVPVTLRLRDAKGAEQQVQVQLAVSARPPAGASAPAHKH